MTEAEKRKLKAVKKSVLLGRKLRNMRPKADAIINIMFSPESDNYRLDMYLTRVHPYIHGKDTLHISRNCPDLGADIMQELEETCLEEIEHFYDGWVNLDE